MRYFLIIISCWVAAVKGNFILQPKYQSACSGTSAKFTLNDTFKSPKVYQWQRRVGVSWVNITDSIVFKGIKNDTLEIPATKDSLDKSLFRCRVTVNSSTQYFSDTASLAVLKLSSAPGGISGINTICLGKQTTFSVTAGSLGYGAKWQWYAGACSGTSIGTGNSIQLNPSISTTYFVRAVGLCNTSSCANRTITVQDTSQPVSSIAGSNVICKGKSMTLAANGGSLGVGATWKWYTSSCGGSALGTGPFINIYPTATTTYFLRAEGTCNTTICKQLTVVLQDTSTRASSISGNSTFCLGKSNTLSVVGGNLGEGASWKWYSSSCGGTSVGTGTSISVSPISSGSHTYFVRAEGTCNTTPCQSVTLTVRDTSLPASRLTGPAEVCFLNNATLSVSGGSLGFAAKWKWYQGNCNGTVIDSGSSVVVSPTSKGSYIYYAKAVGLCNTTVCKSFTLLVRDSSVAPISITGNTATCSGVGVNLAVNGGSLASGASWNWYEASCGGILLGTGNSIVVTPRSQTRYFVRAEGVCNNTICRSLLVDVNDSSTAPVAVNGANTICQGSSVQLNVIGGKLGKSASWKWYSGSCNGSFIGSGSSITVAPSVSTSYFVRAEGLCNTTGCASIKITVQDTSKPADSISGLSNICLGKGIVLTVNGGKLGAGSHWKWYKDACAGLPLGVGENLSISPTASSVYYVRAEGNCNNTNCKQVSVLVKDTSVPAVAITGANEVCIWGRTQLQMVGGKLGFGAKWVWYKDSCGNAKGNIGLGGVYQTQKLTNSTTYFVRAEGDCNATICAPYLVRVHPKPNITPIHDTVCYGETANIGVAGGIFYNWLPAPGLKYFTTDRNEVMYSNAVFVPTQFSYTIIGTDWNQCSDTVQATVLVNPLPKLISTPDTGVCPGRSVTIKTLGAQQYKWVTTDGIVDVASNQNTVTPTESKKYIIQGIDGNACSNFDTVAIEVYENPIANAGDDSSICKSSSIQLSGKGGVVYSWSPSVALDSSSISNPKATPTVTTQYTLKVVDANGCKDSDVVVVTVVENPLPSFTGKNVVCKNEHGVEFQATASGNNYFWSIQNGEINGGQGMSKVVTHWSDAAPSGKITLVESLKQSPYCSTALEKTITIGGTVAPTPEKLVLKANKIESNILICPNCLFDTLQWGYEEKQNRAEKNTCTDLVWCRYSQIDTFNNFYWVKIGNDPACLTKSYFNAPKLLGIYEDVSHGIAEIYPNPTNGLAKVRTTGIMKKIVVYNAIGLEILHVTPSSFNYECDLDLTSYARGIYFVKVFEDEGVSVLQLVLND